MHFKSKPFSYITVFTMFILRTVVTNGLTISFTPNSTVTIHMDDVRTIKYVITNVSDAEAQREFSIYSLDTSIASLEKEIILVNPQVNFEGSFNLSGIFLGTTAIACRNIETNERAEGSLDVIVIRKERIIDRVFTISVALLVSIIYVNFGCAINWKELPIILKKPIGPAIGFCGQFILMPLLSYGLGQLLFPDNVEMQLGMFFAGVAPGGGASNVWTVLLDGNMSLSIIMSTISTIAAFGMMPLWIFTLGRVIFDSGNLDVPYTQITTFVVALVIPLGIGFLIQRYLPRFANFMKRILKGFSTLLILFIIVFAIVTNLYLFQLFSWRIVVAGMALPWLAYILGFLTGKLFRQPSPDCITIAVEIGIQNTGISIFLLRFALPQPQADLTTIAPVSVAILTPFPLIFLFICLKIKSRLAARKSKVDDANKDDVVASKDDVVASKDDVVANKDDVVTNDETVEDPVRRDVY